MSDIYCIYLGTHTRPRKIAECDCDTCRYVMPSNKEGCKAYNLVVKSANGKYIGYVKP